MIKKCILPLLLVIALLFPSTAYALPPTVPDFSGAAAIELNRNIPAFLPAEITTENFAAYSELDALGRPGQATACVSRDSLPTTLRADSDDLLPVGWVSARYEGVIDGRWLYSVGHVIAPALSGSDTDPRNAFTATRCLCQEGMKLFEDRIADYITRTTNHVLYRVTPVYRGNDLVPLGVQLEAYSVEDEGRTISFNVFLYNIQPGIAIDYKDGKSQQDAAVELTVTAAEFLRAHDLPVPAEMVPPSVASFSALYDKQMKDAAATAKPQTQVQPQQNTRTVYIPGTDVGVYHLIPNCSSITGEKVTKTSEKAAIESGHILCTGDCAQYDTVNNSGANERSGLSQPVNPDPAQYSESSPGTFVLNTSTGKCHYYTCPELNETDDVSKAYFQAVDEAIDAAVYLGLEFNPCEYCM